MNRLFDFGNEYARRSDWKDFALVKVCLAAMGVLIGLGVPKKHKGTASLLAAAVFTVTYIPLINKVLHILQEHQDTTAEE